MEIDENMITDPMNIGNEEQVNGESYDIKSSRPKVSDDRTSNVSPIRKITIRQSNDSEIAQQTSYEIITKKRRDSRSLHSPTTHLDRYESQSPQEKALNNGLDPIGIELISSHANEREYCDELVSPKMNREMKNLQKSTNDSKILSNYLNTPTESPRRSRKNKDIPIVDPDEHFEVCDSVLKESPEVLEFEVESDPQALPMEPPEKRRKSISRSRSRIRSASVNRGRKKSIARQLKDELQSISDKEEEIGEEEDEDLSEVSFVTNRSIDGRAVNPPPKPGWDSFCFKCHTDTAVLSLACSKCKCSYHRHCVRPNPIPKNVDEFVCPECREIEHAEVSNDNKYGHEKIDVNTLSEMLMMILEKIRTYPDRDQFENDIVVKVTKEPSQPFIITQMSLKILEARIKSCHYKVTEAFVHDIKQLEHNWSIVDRSKSKTLKTILKNINTEINELEACVFCYEKSFITSNWFVHPCKRPHLLIWAKLKGYPYWPAKVMSIDSRQQVDVRFFGAHDRAWVPAAHCLLFSEKDPNKTKGSTPTNNKNASKTQKGIADAMKEKDDYIEHLRARYGFKYSPFRTQFNGTDLQKHLEFMLPGLKNISDGVEKTPKEKLTLKIVKGGPSNYQVEHKQEKPKLYKVLSKTDDNADLEQPGKLSFIIKRKSNVEQEVDKPKKLRANEAGSETSESNLSTQGGRAKLQRRNSTLPAQKHKKMAKASNKGDIQSKKAKHADKQKPQKHNGIVFDEVTVTRTVKRTRARSILDEADQPLIVPLVIPPGTNEIQALRETSKSPRVEIEDKSRTSLRSRSIEKDSTKDLKLHRSRSTEKDVVDSKHLRRVSTNSSKIKRSMSHIETVNKVVETTVREVEPPVKDQENEFDPNLVIKNEPVSDGEEVLQRDALTLSDIPNLIQDNGGRKKTIVISTSDNSGSSTLQQQKSRARKTFPNNPNQMQVDALASQNSRHGSWMVCIPQGFNEASSSGSQGLNMQSPPTSNRSTPHSDSQHRSNASSSRTTPNPPANRALQTVPVASFGNSSHRRNTNQMNGQVSRVNSQNDQNRRQMSNDLPALIPRPQGIFVNEGSTLHKDVGPVSRMFTDNAHRISDFFRNLLVDTVSSFAPDVPAAENLMLRGENEKLQRDIQTLRSECQLRLHEIKREHQEEIDSLKRTFDERLKAVQQTFEVEKARISNEIIHQCESDKQRAIEITRKETKKTTWCSNCTKEARFYCCWNTSYCGTQCQKTHWQLHQKYCTNKNSVTESPPASVKQNQNESQVMIAQSTRPTLVLRAPAQQAVSMPSQLTPPISIQQHVVIPSSVTSSSGLGQNSQAIVLGSYQSKNRAIQSIFHEQAVRDLPLANLIVKAIPNNENMIFSSIPVTDAVMLQASAIPTSTSQE